MGCRNGDGILRCSKAGALQRGWYAEPFPSQLHRRKHWIARGYWLPDRLG
jgi:hypothetical protein